MKYLVWYKISPTQINHLDCTACYACFEICHFTNERGSTYIQVKFENMYLDMRQARLPA